MRPILFELGFLPIRSYGLLVALGFVLIMQVSVYVAREKGIDKQKMMDALFVLVISGILGARILYIITNYESFLANPLDIIKIWNGGLVFYGGMIGVMVSLSVFCWKNKLRIVQILDILAVALPLGHASGRLGCLMAGCCHGLPVHDKMGNLIESTQHAPWYAIKFPTDVGSFAPTETYLYASQIYASIYNLLIFLFMFFVVRRFAKKEGTLLGVYLIIYSIFRSINEVFRGDEERKFIIKNILTTSQGISIIMILLALYLVFIHSKPREQT